MAILVNMLQGTLVKSLNVYAPHLVRSPPYPSVPKSILPASAFTTASRPGGLHPLLTQEPAHQALPRLPLLPSHRAGCSLLPLFVKREGFIFFLCEFIHMVGMWKMCKSITVPVENHYSYFGGVLVVIPFLCIVNILTWWFIFFHLTII